MFVDKSVPVLPKTQFPVWLFPQVPPIDVEPFVVKDTFRVLLVKSNAPPDLEMLRVILLLAPNAAGPALRTKHPPPAAGAPPIHPKLPREAPLTVQLLSARPVAVPILLTSKAAKPFTPAQSPLGAVAPVVTCNCKVAPLLMTLRLKVTF